MTAIPDRGDIVRLNFDPTRGHEQAGARPALVVSPRVFNRASGLALCCPIKGRRKGYPFEVPLPANPDVHGVVLVDQLRSVDWRARGFRFVMRAPAPVVADVMAKLKTLVL